MVFGAIFFVSILGFITLSETASSNSYNTDLTYNDIDGNTIRLTDHKGKVILIYFFSLSCIFCKISDPFLAAVEDDFPSSQLLIITITIETTDSNFNLNSWKSNLNATWTIVRDDVTHSYSGHWDVAYTPTTIIIDQNSKFVKKIVGSNDFDANIRTEINSLI
jgi:thiol-disulfide isomerase/thioredoxin